MSNNTRQKKEVEDCIKKIEDELCNKQLDEHIFSGSIKYTDIVEDVTIEEIKQDSEEYYKLKKLQANPSICSAAKETLRSILDQFSFEANRRSSINIDFCNSFTTNSVITNASQKIYYDSNIDNLNDFTSESEENLVNEEKSENTIINDQDPSSKEFLDTNKSSEKDTDSSNSVSGSLSENNFESSIEDNKDIVDKNDAIGFEITSESYLKIFEDVSKMSKMFETVMEKIKKEKFKIYNAFRTEHGSLGNLFYTYY